MVSRSSYDELMTAYDERGALLFEGVHLLNRAVQVLDTCEEPDELDEQIQDFLSRARIAGFA